MSKTKPKHKFVFCFQGHQLVFHYVNFCLTCRPNSLPSMINSMFLPSRFNHLLSILVYLSHLLHYNRFQACWENCAQRQNMLLYFIFWYIFLASDKKKHHYILISSFAGHINSWLAIARQEKITSSYLCIDTIPKTENNVANMK